MLDRDKLDALGRARGAGACCDAELRLELNEDRSTVHPVAVLFNSILAPGDSRGCRERDAPPCENSLARKYKRGPLDIRVSPQPQVQITRKWPPLPYLTFLSLLPITVSISCFLSSSTPPSTLFSNAQSPIHTGQPLSSSPANTPGVLASRNRR